MGNGGSNPRWHNRDFNPWRFRVADCVTRAISAALMMKYEVAAAVAAEDGSVWDMSPGCRFVNGAFTEKVLAALNADGGFFGPPADAGGKTALNGFVDGMQREGRTGIYLAEVGDRGFANHVVCVTIQDRGSYFTDTADCGEDKVFSYWKVARQVPEGDPRRLDARTFFRPGAWKRRFRKVFFEIAAEYAAAKDAAQKEDALERMRFLTSGELYDFDDPDAVDMDEIAGKRVSAKAREILGI